MDKKEFTTSSLEKSGELVSSSDWDENTLNPYGKFKGSSTTIFFEKGTQLTIRNEADKVVFNQFFMHEEFKKGGEKENGSSE